MSDHTSVERGLFADLSRDTARALCMSAGDFCLLAAAEVERLLAKHHKRRPETYAEALGDLVIRGAITASDAETLKQVTLAAFTSRTDRTAASRAEIVGGYHKLLVDPQSSPAALAIASTAVRALDARPMSPGGGGEQQSIAKISVGDAATFGVGGALIGAGVGAGFGPIGAGIGALVGGAVGAGISISNDLGV